jgi:cytochrome c-type biogenesis protein CcmH/NrfG
VNQQMFEAGVAAYQRGDWSIAALQLSQAKSAGELSGRADHLRGNALMKLHRFEDAAAAYAEALRDESYGKRGALNTNRGRALIAAGHVDEAINALTAATQDSSYKNAYKAYLALGGAYLELKDARSAGIAYRYAAIDENNPDPCEALRKLGDCFMELGRPTDAVESYRTALDFSSLGQNQNAIYCELALAYVATNRMNEAVDAFTHATADGTYILAPEAQASFDAAKNAVAAVNARRPSDTDNFLAEAGYGPASIDPLDPTGETTGNLMPSPEDTGFFSVTEEQLMADDKKRRKSERKKRHRGRKVLLVLLLLIIILGGVCGLAYYQGFGWPTQEAVVESLFEAKTNNEDVSAYLASSVSDTDASQIEAIIPSGAEITIQGVDRSRQSSTVLISARLAQGGDQAYTIELTRDGVSWKVTSVEPSFVSQQGTSTSGTTSGTVSTN